MEFLSAFWVAIADNPSPLIAALIGLYAVNVWKSKLRADVHLDLLQRLLSSWMALSNERLFTYRLTRFTRGLDSQNKISKDSDLSIENQSRCHFHATATLRATFLESELLGTSEATQCFEEILIKNVQEANIKKTLKEASTKSPSEFGNEQSKNEEMFYKWAKENFGDLMKAVKITPKSTTDNQA